MLTERDHKTQSPQQPDDNDGDGDFDCEECHWHLAATRHCCGSQLSYLPTHRRVELLRLEYLWTALRREEYARGNLDSTTGGSCLQMDIL